MTDFIGFIVIKNATASLGDRPSDAVVAIHDIVFVHHTGDSTHIQMRNECWLRTPMPVEHIRALMDLALRKAKLPEVSSFQ